MGKKGRHFPLKVMLQSKIFERTLKKAQETITKWAPEIAKVRSKKHKRPAQNEHQKSPSFVQKSTRDQHKMSTRNRQVSFKKAQETSTKWAPEIAKFRSKKHKRPAQNEHQKSPSFVQKSTRDQHKTSTRNRQVSFEKAQETAQNEHQKSPSFLQKSTRDQHKTSTRNRQVSFKKAQETSTKWAPEIVKFRSKKHKRPAQNEHQKSPSFGLKRDKKPPQKSRVVQKKQTKIWILGASKRFCTHERKYIVRKGQATNQSKKKHNWPAQNQRQDPSVFAEIFLQIFFDQIGADHVIGRPSFKKAQETSTKRAPEIAKYRSKKHKRPAQNEHQKSPSFVRKSTRDSTKRAPEIAKFRSKKHKRPAQNEH